MITRAHHQRWLLYALVAIQVIAGSWLFAAASHRNQLQSWSWIDNSSVFPINEDEENAIIQSVLRYIVEKERNAQDIYVIYGQTNNVNPPVEPYATRTPLPCASFNGMERTTRLLDEADLQGLCGDNSPFRLHRHVDMLTIFDGSGHGWDNLSKRYANCGGLVELSRPGISAAGDVAIISVCVTCGQWNSSGRLFILHNANGKWNVHNVIQTWKSGLNAPHPR